ncbi:hypothetical protein BMW24_011275 [Mycobacterium heckeshornense]|uniref:hypothetical protein n=1 Tax=Mycobacterium heckeshornense TaxID=110505 RepID=UPI000662BCC0|nr:hypothetical protein [Mycobacterium heckeshornense]KMV21125.1 hypothetical protein ACT16_18210 [Mycobacterium heckeshornense]MCV7032988.1 hypothetical protein [Mycobacterium heckeshornense]PIJ34586.1 hypothetical protein BMW24_011275 [Mycobacterium heckeshornense]
MTRNDRPPRSRSVIATVVALCVFAAALGGWVLQFERAVSVPPPTSPTSLVAAHADQPSFDHKKSPVSQTAFKSAGLKRNRPEPSLRLDPALREVPLPGPAGASSWTPGGADSAAPAIALAGHDLLTQFCVARR